MVSIITPKRTPSTGKQKVKKSKRRIHQVVNHIKKGLKGRSRLRGNEREPYRRRKSKKRREEKKKKKRTQAKGEELITPPAACH
jgi:hypothetical protein